MGAIHDLVFALVPAVYIELGPAQAVMAFCAGGWLYSEWAAWRKYR